MVMIYRAIILLCSIIIATACHTPSNYTELSESVSIAQLKSLCKGDHHRIVEDITVQGVVVAGDWLGELHKSIIIADETGGLEIAIESQNISSIIPTFCRVAIQCNGLMLARVGGKIELGASPTGDFLLDNISEEMIERHIRIVERSCDILPATKQFSEIGSDDISRYVKFDHIRICDMERGLSWCDEVDDEYVTTIRTFIDSEGNTFAIQTLPTCKYAHEKIPENEISVAGVIDFSDNRYFLRIVNKSIIQ